MFLGTHHNKFDAKGRISVPAQFRRVLEASAKPNTPLLILRPHPTLPCLEGWSNESFQTLAARLEQLDPITEEYQDLAASIYADACPLDSDQGGRVVIPTSLRDRAELSGDVVFTGLGKLFQLWTPENWSERHSHTSERAKKISERASKKDIG